MPVYGTAFVTFIKPMDNILPNLNRHLYLTRLQKLFCAQKQPTMYNLTVLMSKKHSKRYGHHRAAVLFSTFSTISVYLHELKAHRIQDHLSAHDTAVCNKTVWPRAILNLKNVFEVDLFLSPCSACSMRWSNSSTSNSYVSNLLWPSFAPRLTFYMFCYEGVALKHKTVAMFCENLCSCVEGTDFDF